MASKILLTLLLMFCFLLSVESAIPVKDNPVDERIYIVKTLVKDTAILDSLSSPIKEAGGGGEKEDEGYFTNENEQQVQQQHHQQYHHPQNPPLQESYQQHNQQQQQQQHHHHQLQHQHHHHHHQQQQQQQQQHYHPQDPPLQPIYHQQVQLQHQQQQMQHLQQENLLAASHNNQQQEKVHQHYHEPYQSPSYSSLLQTPSPQYFVSTQIEWKHGTIQNGELSEIFVNNIETSFPLSQEEVAYYQYQRVEQKHILRHHSRQEHHHLMYSTNLNDDHDINNNRPFDSCDTQDPFAEPTCRATPQVPTSSMNPSTGGQPGNVPNFSHKPSHNSNVESFPLTPQHYHYESSLISAIRHYWREVSGLCLASAIFLNWLFVVIKRRFIASGLSRTEQAIEPLQQATSSSQSVSKDTNSNSAHDSAFEETASPISLEFNESSSDEPIKVDKSSSSAKSLINTMSTMRQRSSTLKADPIPIPISPNRKTQSVSLSNSLNTSEYNSRYSSDFDSIQRLGRGGFGIVFEARNKIDDCHYAVKRICLPLEKEARERVMREVRALAKLDHAGIVRYYNAWLETPPDEWLNQHDAQLGVSSKDGVNFPSTDGIYDRNESEQVLKGKVGESGDTSSGLFGSSPFKRRANGFRKFLKNNSSSPSLDIVFEGSGSIRLESENNTEKTGSSIIGGDIIKNKAEYKNNSLQESKNGDNISDSEDSDFIQFESRSNKVGSKHMSKLNNDEVSNSSHLTDPFSSSSSSNSEDGGVDGSSKKDINEIRRSEFNIARRKALNYQKELKQLNNASLVENLHVEKVYLYIQMQLCRKDTLKDWLKTNCETRDKTTIFDLFYQIVDAVEYVHSQDLIHRDLKPSNIFFSLDGTLKIGDFGLCRAKTSTGIGSSLDLQEYVAESDVERGFEAVHTEQVGTQLYMSPEQLNGLSYNQKVDIFAMGLILLELLIPFKTQMQRVNVLFKARNNLYSDEFRSEHPQEYELVKSLLSRSPLKRPTATEIKQHELLASAQLSQPVIERIYHRRRTISSNSSTE